jgi:hypothetical protein
MTGYQQNLMHSATVGIVIHFSHNDFMVLIFASSVYAEHFRLQSRMQINGSQLLHQFPAQLQFLTRNDRDVHPPQEP